MNCSLSLDINYEILNSIYNLHWFACC